MRMSEGFGFSIPSWARRLFAADLLVAALALALLFATLYGAYRVVTERAEDEAVLAAAQVADRDARMLVEYWASVQEQITHLQGMAKPVTLAQRSGDRAAMDRALRDLRLALSASIPGFVQVAATDPQGFATWSTAEAGGVIVPPLDLSDREHIQAIVKQGLDSFVGQPVIGRVSGQRTIQFSAAQRSEDGTLIGVSVVSFQLERAEKLEQRITRNSRDLIVLFRTDNTVLATRTGQGVGLRFVRLSQNPAGQDDGKVNFIRRPGRIDGIRRIFVSRDVPNSALIVAVGIDEATALQSATKFEKKLRIGMYLFGLLATLLACATVIAFERAREAEAKASWEALLHEIAARSHDIIGVLDHDLRYVFVNDSIQTLLGLAPSELIGKPAGGFALTEYREEVLAKLRSLTGTDESYRVTAPFKTKDGQEIWLEYDVCHIQLPGADEASRNGWFFIGRDVTARKAAEEELKFAHDNLNALADTGPGLLFSSTVTGDGPGKILYASKNLGTLLGYDDVTGHERGFLRSVLHPDDIERNKAFRQVLQRDGHAVGEHRLRHKDGHYVWFRESATAKLQPDGSHLLSGFAQDITQEKEQAARLELAQRMLSLGELASGLGHELGQPLSVISMAAENAQFALEHDPGSVKAVKGKLDQILRMTQRAGQIIENMRSVGRAANAETSESKLSDLVADVLKIMQDRLEAEEIHVCLEAVATLPAVLVPPVLFQQVLTNLLANACDAYRDAPAPSAGEKSIRIEGQAEKGWVELRIKDQAGGVPLDVIDHVFDQFFTTKGSKKGTGLGLSICYGIIRQAGGTLSVHNEDGGAVFEIQLPANAHTDLLRDVEGSSMKPGERDDASTTVGEGV